eukprot:4682792-Amphidinium_carterae.1
MQEVFLAVHAGMGMPSRKRKGTRGDLVITFDITSQPPQEMGDYPGPCPKPMIEQMQVQTAPRRDDKQIAGTRILP